MRAPDFIFFGRTKTMPNDGSNNKKMSIICTKGTLDWAYPPFILATTAASMDVDVTMFST